MNALTRFTGMVLAALWIGAIGLIIPALSQSQNAPSDPSQPRQSPNSFAPQLPDIVELPDNLDALFALLKRQRDQTKARKISKKIWKIWFVSNSKSIDLLSGWAREAMSKKQYSVALDLLDQVTTLQPTYAEGWNQRATLHYLMGSLGKSIADVERVLELEPRHFGALSGLAIMLQRLDRKRAALDVWHRVLDVYPAMGNAQKSVIRLEEELAAKGT